MQNLITGVILIILTLTLYLVYFKNDKSKLAKTVKKSLRMFIQNSIRIFTIFVIIGLLENFLSKEAVGNFLLNFSGLKGILLGDLIGAIMMGPIASGYPIAKYLFEHGAEIGLVSAFLLSWVMIGTISIPLELKDLGKRFTIVRNLFAFFSVIIIALIMEVLL
ncbi:MAG: hypothetical protein ACPLVD_06555 [Dictyoglomus turgidum]|uniref:hypothetical protein n=1 Tax=Dictyoglomus turgidum TaxID=513050 RepID=UPI003C735C19